MATDLQLSRNFWLHEFSGWRAASEDDVERLAETVARVLQPIRSAFAPTSLIPTSWIQWSDGTMREGAHAQAGTVDFVLADGRTREAYEWADRYLIPGGYVGRLIYEPERSAAEGQAQGEHVHMAPRADMLEAFGDGRIQVLEEKAEGQYVFYQAAAFGLGTAAMAALVFFFRCVAGRGASNLEGAVT